MSGGKFSYEEVADRINGGRRRRDRERTVVFQECSVHFFNYYYSCIMMCVCFFSLGLYVGFSFLVCYLFFVFRE